MKASHTVSTDLGPRPTDAQWHALTARDRGAAGFYGVATTGVYCRMGCPSRRPIRRNVRWFPSGAAAARAGFRPCLRCRPEAADSPPNELCGAAERLEWIRDICRYLESQTGRVPTLRELSERFGRSPAHLQRVFKQATGLSPRAYADALRVGDLKARLRAGETVTGAMVAAGYGSASRLYESAARQLGMTPGAYRERAAGEAITYTTTRCPLGGRLLVAATERGVCAVSMGTRDRELVAGLADEFRNARLQRGDSDFAAALGAYLEGVAPLPPLPVDIRATAFQRRVWDAIATIPLGETRTYAALARSMGAPRAVRAVAQACGRNPVALVIPCHRVVSQSGLGGYRFGAERKEQLLRLDRALAAATSEEPPNPN